MAELTKIFEQLKTNPRLNKRVNTILFIVLVGLMIFFIGFSTKTFYEMDANNKKLFVLLKQQTQLAQDYARQYHETQAKLTQVTQELDENKKLLMTISTELNSTKQLLDQAKEGNIKLKQYAQALKIINEKQVVQLREELESTIKTLQDRNIKLDEQVQALESQVSYLSGNVQSSTQGSALLKEYRKNAKVVRNKIKHFKRQAREAHVATLREVDHMQSLLGNKGYLVKDGSSVQVDWNQYEATNMPLETAEGSQAEHKPKVTVNFVD